MATKSKKKTKTPKKNKFNSEIKHLEILIEFSLRSIDGKSNELDELFNNQVTKIKAQIDKLKGNQ